MIDNPKGKETLRRKQWIWCWLAQQNLKEMGVEQNEERQSPILQKFPKVLESKDFMKMEQQHLQTVGSFSFLWRIWTEQNPIRGYTNLMCSGKEAAS
jgi:hypothetical protein